MTDSAAQLRDRLLPRAPCQQWVLSFPFALRFHLARENAFFSEMLRGFVRTVFAWQRRRGRARGISDGQPAAHALTPDGVFVTCAPAEPPDRAEAAIHRAGLSLLYRQQVLPRPEKPPFLQLIVGTVEPGAGGEEALPLILRQPDGHRTPAHRAVRGWNGL